MAVFSLLPAVALLLAAEVTVRILRLDRPAFYAGGFGKTGEADSIERADVDLGWSMKPGFRTAASSPRMACATNRLGLRSPEVAPKRENELRILSLGESSTMGIGVAAEDTYSQRLQELLGQRLQPRPVTVVNAGVSGYSSFQSLKYLELRGFALRPDIVLFYHELNDYLPSTIRDPGQSEVEILQTDRQLYDSRLVRLSRWLLTRSALYRLASNSYAQRRIRKLFVVRGHEARQVKSPQGEIGIPERSTIVAVPFHLREDGSKQRATEMHPSTIGRRVSEAERLDNLRRLVAVCREKRVALIVMHPSYRPTVRHECVLTRFCAENRVPMLETYDLLHPAGFPPEVMFADAMHPSEIGHQALAEGLLRFILGQGGLSGLPAPRPRPGG
jgi:lysophospholipase L1-like esterase